MKIPKFLDDLSVISKLGDNPGADNGLTAEGLKAKFDEAGLKLQTFLNETLIEKINSLFSLDAPPHEGMNMTGPINMNKNKLGGLADPAEDGDAVSLDYANRSYRASSWTPSAAEVGAAPDGYGLGDIAPYKTIATTEQLDNCRSAGFYRYGITGSNLAGVGFNFGSLTVYPIWTDGCVQEVRPMNGNCMIRRFFFRDVWSAWEVDNPPMASGVEYRTTERWRGKVVYKKLVDFGSLPANASSGVPVGVSGLNVCRATGSAFTSSGEYTAIPMGSGGAFGAYFWVDPNGQLYVRTMQDLSAYSGAFVLEYVKD